MVNVNKNIVPGKSAESSAKTDPQAPARRPRNQELNSSKKTVGVTHGETHATEQNPFKAKLSCSRKLNCSVTGNITSDVYDKLYTREDDPQKVADVLGCTVEDVKEIDSETEDLGYGKTVGYLLAKPEYEEELNQNGIEILSILEDGTVGMMVGRGFHTVETDLEQVLDRVGEDLDSACGENTANESLDSSCGSKLNSADDESGEPAGKDAEAVVITTESGNEVALSDIKIVQNPDTNELALFVKETEDDEIPEGFVVIADAAQAALPSNNTCPECGQAPCVCEGAGETGGEEEGEELDSSRKKNESAKYSVDSSLGGGDDRQDATSQVTVPKSFPDDKVYDLYRWVESELQREDIDVDVYSVDRPSARTIRFEFEVTGKDPAEVDAIIEDRVREFIANGNNAIRYSEGDPRSELNGEGEEIDSSKKKVN